MDSLRLVSDDRIELDLSKIEEKEKGKGIVELVKEYEQVRKENRLLLVDYITLSEYLGLLKLSSSFLTRFHARALLYLAAAVSDFYIPAADLVSSCGVHFCFLIMCYHVLSYLIISYQASTQDPVGRWSVAIESSSGPETPETSHTRHRPQCIRRIIQGKPKRFKGLKVQHFKTSTVSAGNGFGSSGVESERFPPEIRTSSNSLELYRTVLELYGTVYLFRS